MVDLRQKMACEHSRVVAKAVLASIDGVQALSPHLQIMGSFIAAHVLLREHGMGIRDIHDISTNYIDGWINQHPETQAVTDCVKEIAHHV